MFDIRKKWVEFCLKKNVKIQNNTSILSYDNSSLFCPAGMQQFKKEFKDKKYKDTISNIQPCLRLNDLNEIGDKIHFLYFNMLGLFSFRKMSLKESISFWVEFLEFINLKIDYVTIHPDKFNNWKNLYKDYDFTIKKDKNCIWSDNDKLSGYCTEFYSKNIEIGNIVNINGDCIDCGFGLERLDMLINGISKTKEEILKETIIKIIKCGIKPSNNNQGYILKKLMRKLIRIGGDLKIEEFKKEKKKFEIMISKYNKLKIKNKNKNKSKKWWYETHGIIIDDI